MKFYKYRSFQGQSRQFTNDIVVNSNLYFAKPNEFNDPFEFQVNIVTSATRDQFTKYLEVCGFNEMPMLSKMNDKQFNEYIAPLLNGRDALGWHSVINKLKNKYGILCLSDSCLNINMWSQYGDCHRGVCFEFESLDEDDIFFHAKKIEYLKDPPKVEIVKEYINEHGRKELARKFVYSKYETAWDHEKEWRVLTNVPGVTSFPKACLKAIYLGSEYKLSDPFTDLVKEHRPDIDIVLLKKGDAYFLDEKWRTKPELVIY